MAAEDQTDGDEVMNEFSQIGMTVILIVSIINAIVFLFTKSQLSAFMAIWIVLIGIFLELAK